MIEVAPLDAESEEELEDVETPEHARQLRWQRVVQAAVKQSLRRARKQDFILFRFRNQGWNLGFGFAHPLLLRRLQ